MVGDSVKGVAPELVIPDLDEEKIELDSTFDVDHFVLAFAHLKQTRTVLTRFQVSWTRQYPNTEYQKTRLIKKI